MSLKKMLPFTKFRCKTSWQCPTFNHIIGNVKRSWRNRQTRTFEGRMVTPSEFKSRWPHHKKNKHRLFCAYFFLCARKRDLNLCAKNLHTTMLCIVRTVRPTNASIWWVNSPRFTIRSFHSLQASQNVWIFCNNYQKSPNRRFNVEKIAHYRWILVVDMI